MIRAFFSLFQTLGHSLVNNLNNGEKNVTITKSSIFFSFYGRRRSSDGKIIFVVFLVWLICLFVHFYFAMQTSLLYIDIFLDVRTVVRVCVWLRLRTDESRWYHTVQSTVHMSLMSRSHGENSRRSVPVVLRLPCVHLIHVWATAYSTTHYLGLHNSYSLRMLSTQIDIRMEKGKMKHVKMKLEPCTVDGIM